MRTVRIFRALALRGNCDYDRAHMKRFLAVLLLIPSISVAATAPTFDEKAAERFAKLALACV